MIPFSPPRIDQAILDEVCDTLRSGWITTGPKTKKFEKELATFCGNPATLCVNSATSGLELMLRWFGVKEGDEVILPAYTYSATANVVMHCGATPVFVDVNDDFNISTEQIRKAITVRTKVIMPVDFGGWVCDYDLINALVNELQVKVLFQASTPEQQILGRILILSDAAHSLGAIYKGRNTGTLADISVFSFHAVKNLTTAEGGAVALNLPAPFNNQEIYQKLCVTILHGQDKDALSKSQAGNWRYDIVEAGYKMNMTDILASIGLVELRRYRDDTLKRREEICLKYSEGLAKHDWAELPVQTMGSGVETSRSCWHLFPLRIRGISEATRDEIIRRISSREVSVNVHFIPVPMTSYYRSLGYDIRNYPKTFSLYEREISLPVYYHLTNEQIETVLHAVIGSVEEVLNTAQIR